jgi:transposase
MARKTYSPEFRQRAVDLYESTPGATLRGIASDLGIQDSTLADWVRKYGSGTTTDQVTAPPGGAKAEPAAVRIARLEAELAAERADRRKVETERDILRQAAKYFAGETRW